MGYTHYWTFGNDIDKVSKATLQSMMNALKNIVNDNLNILAGPLGVDCPMITDSIISFNGRDDESHETFLVDISEIEPDGFNFCKTARKPYDKVVVACLMTMKYYLGDDIRISSDGYSEIYTDKDFQDAVEFGMNYIINPYSNSPMSLQRERIEYLNECPISWES